MDFAVCPVHGCGDGAGALVTHLFLDGRLDRSIEHDGQDSRQSFAVYHCDEVGHSSAYPGRPRHHARSRPHAILITAQCTDTSAARFSGVRVGPLDDVDGGTDVMLGTVSVWTSEELLNA